MSKATPCKIEFDGEDMFVIVNGVKIAKRGHRGTPQARTWISLEPKWTVLSNRNQLVVLHKAGMVH